jgi:hypothetical protein
VAKQFASRLSLIAFSVTALRGLITDADFQGTVETGLIVAACFFVLGLVCGELARHLVEEHVHMEVERLFATDVEDAPQTTEPAST